MIIFIEVAEDKLSFDIFIEGKPCILHTEGRAKQVSAAGTAQVSFRKLDLSDETVDRVYSRLVDEDTPHASCVEHQATPMRVFEYAWCGGLNAIDYFGEGKSHMDSLGNLWSGNFKHWIQNRKLIPNEAYTGKFTITNKENK